MDFIIPFVISLVVFGVLSFGYIAVGAAGGFGGGGNSTTRRLSRLIIAVAAVYTICVLLFTSGPFILGSLVAGCAVAVFWMLQR